MNSTVLNSGEKAVQIVVCGKQCILIPLSLPQTTTAFNIIFIVLIIILYCAELVIRVMYGVFCFVLFFKGPNV